MGSVIGIICEYNPFHTGHSYHIAASELLLGEHAPVVCVMSGDFVQRGETAIFPKHQRAAEAVGRGADLVVELPLPWCLSSAEKFAYGGVAVLDALGATHLSFGSESGDTDKLKAAADSMDDNFQLKLKEYINNNPQQSYASAVSNVSGSDLLLKPNDLLGIEYIKAIRMLSSDMVPMAVKRFTDHDGFNSAKDIREKIYAGEIPGDGVNREIIETAVISRLRMFSKEYFNTLPNTAGGLGGRLYDAVRSSSTLEQIYENAKTKRYSLSAIRRAVMCAALGIENGLNSGRPPFIRVLAFNDKGREYLSSVKGKSSIPIITQPKEISALDENAQKVFALGAAAKDLYELGLSSKSSPQCGNDYRMGPIIV